MIRSYIASGNRPSIGKCQLDRKKLTQQIFSQTLFREKYSGITLVQHKFRFMKSDIFYMDQFFHGKLSLLELLLGYNSHISQKHVSIMCIKSCKIRRRSDGSRYTPPKKTEYFFGLYLAVLALGLRTQVGTGSRERHISQSQGFVRGQCSGGKQLGWNLPGGIYS